MYRPTHIPKKKLFIGKTRICRPLIRADEELLLWACSIKPGDYIATCEGTNRKVAEVVPHWQNVGRWLNCKVIDNKVVNGRTNKHWYMDEVRFTDTHGRWHYCPAGGCALPKETPEEIAAFQFNFAKAVLAGKIEYYKEDEVSQQHYQMIFDYVSQGKAIVDEFGELLPELDRR